MSGRLAIDLTRSANDDIADILDQSVEQFGSPARRRYEILLETALEGQRFDPLRNGSREWPEFGAGVHTYHLRYSRARAHRRGGRVGTPRQLIAYVQPTADRLLILRVLHDAMDLARHLPPRLELG